MSDELAVRRPPQHPDGRATTVPGRGDPRTPAEVLAGCGDLARAMLDQHIPDVDGMCDGCAQLGRPTRYPCGLRRLAAEAMVLQARWRAGLSGGVIHRPERPVPVPDPGELLETDPVLQRHALGEV